MKLPPFEYEAPHSVPATLDLLAQYGPDAKLLAGGQSLLPIMALRLAQPEILIDLRRLAPGAGIRQDGRSTTIDAMVRERTLERSDVVASRLPLLASAVPHIGHDAIRSRGTIGGSIAHADSAAELPAVALALDAEFVLASAARGERTVQAVDFFQGFYTTPLEDDEMLTEVRFPAAGRRTVAAFEEVARRHGDFAIVGCGVSLELDDDDVVSDARVVLIGVAPTPVRRPDVEASLVGTTLGADAYYKSAEAAADGLTPVSDLHGSSAYRLHLCRVITRRALECAARRGEARA